MLSRLAKGRRRLEELARRPIPGPVDMLNLITLRSNQTYKWYGLSVLPVLSAVGGRVKWLGYREESLVGTPQADKLIIVRFPSHRRFLAMVANPYFAVANKVREAAVEYFELSFTFAHVRVGKLADCELVAGIHYNPRENGLAHDAVGRLFDDGPGRFVYASSEQSPLVASDDDLEGRGRAAENGRRLKGSDPHPLTFKRLALITYPAVEDARSDLAERHRDLQTLASEFSVQLYRRAPKAGELPWAKAAGNGSH